MKKIIFLSILAISVWGCSKKVTPAASTGTTTAPVVATVPATAEEIAAGQTTFVARCQKCHKLKDPGKFTATKWESILNKMAPKAKLDDTEKKNVLAYVQANAKKV